MNTRGCLSSAATGDACRPDILTLTHTKFRQEPGRGTSPALSALALWGSARAPGGSECLWDFLFSVFAFFCIFGRDGILTVCAVHFLFLFRSDVCLMPVRLKLWQFASKSCAQNKPVLFAHLLACLLNRSLAQDLQCLRAHVPAGLLAQMLARLPA